MSTKVTIAYGNKPHTDFHLYFDFNGCEYHLDFYGENPTKLIIPNDAMEAILKQLEEKDFYLPGNLDYLEQRSKENEIEYGNEDW